MECGGVLCGWIFFVFYESFYDGRAVCVILIDHDGDYEEV